MTPKQVRKLLEEAGFVFTRQSGSHAIFKHPLTKVRIVLPMHNRDLPPGTLHAILKDAGLTLN